jgi:hypothetical protein
MMLSVQGLEADPSLPAEVELYASFGFRPQFLTATLIGAVDPDGPREPIRQRSPSFELNRLSQLTGSLEETMLANCRRIAERHYPGMDYSKELLSVRDLHLGETLLLGVGERLYGFAICHTAPGSEADADREGYQAVAARGYRLHLLRLRMVRPIDDLLSDPSPFHFNDWR